MNTSRQSASTDTLFTTLDTVGILRFVDERRGEDLTLDSKTAPSHFANREDRKTLASAISGFANSSGGLIIWGIDARRGPDEIDCAQQAVPLADAVLFLAKLVEHSASSTSPPVPGVVHRIVEGPGGPFALTYVPEGSGGPYMAKGGEDRYYQRSGDRFVRMEHFGVADMFGRRRRPRLVLTLTKEPNGGLLITLTNEGRGVAKSPYLSLALPSNFRPSQYGFDGNGRFGLRFVGHAYGKCTFGGDTDKVIHSEQSLLVSRIDATVIGVNNQPIIKGLQTFDYELAAEDVPLERGSLVVEY